MKDKVGKILLLRLEGLDDGEIAEQVGLARRTIKQYMYYAGQKGWLTSPDPEDALLYELSHKVVNNVREFLNSDSPMIKLDMTKEAAKGMGLFRQHSATKIEGVQQMSAIQVNVVMPEGDRQDVRAGSIGSVPAIEGRLVEGD